MHFHEHLLDRVLHVHRRAPQTRNPSGDSIGVEPIDLAAVSRWLWSVHELRSGALTLHGQLFLCPELRRTFHRNVPKAMPASNRTSKRGSSSVFVAPTAWTC